MTTSKATAIYAYEELARAAFEAFHANIGDRPSWEQISPLQRRAWEAAARHVENCHSSQRILTTEEWRNWTKP